MQHLSEKQSYPSPEQSIIRKLDYFYRNNKIPHILFYGPTHSNKDRIVSDYINQIYGENKATIKHNVLFVSCSGKGIKFIRDEIKTFSKMHIQIRETTHTTTNDEKMEEKEPFKTVVLMNADFLTDDAQSALRRSIELFSYNTRFFLMVENRSKLLKPILSRFCEIYVPPKQEVRQVLPCINNQSANFCRDISRIADDITELGPQPLQKDLVETVTGWIEGGYSSYDFLHYVETLDSSTLLQRERCIYIQFLFHKWKTEYRCEKLFLWTLLDFFLFRSYTDLQELCSHS